MNKVENLSSTFSALLTDKAKSVYENRIYTIFDVNGENEFYFHDSVSGHTKHKIVTMQVLCSVPLNRSIKISEFESLKIKEENKALAKLANLFNKAVDLGLIDYGIADSAMVEIQMRGPGLDRILSIWVASVNDISIDVLNESIGEEVFYKNDVFIYRA